jgi:DNA (cytosine-5)-methyltransferase 1
MAGASENLLGAIRGKAADLRSERLAIGLPQGEAAKRARVHLADLKRWERGFEMPPAEALERLALVLGCEAKALARAQRRFRGEATPGEGYTTAKVDIQTVFSRSRQPEKGKRRVLDLFCGSGGFSFGFEQTGRFAVTAGIDLLPDRTETFTANHPTANAVVGDIRDFPIDRLDEEGLSPEVVIGGPPCQGFSSIRPFRMCTLGDPRNNLFEQFALVVEKLRPRWFVLENVVGLLTHGDGEVLPSLMAAFGEAGYKTDWRVLNAAHYGLPQNRERLVVVGNRDGRRFEWPEPTHEVNHRSMAGKAAKRVGVMPLFSTKLEPAVTVMDAIHDLPEIAAGERATEYRSDVRPTEYERSMREGSECLTLHEATAHSARMLEIIRLAGANRWALPEGLTTSGFSSSYSRLEPDRPSVTLTVNFVHPASNKCIHPYQDRALTPREGARLQGFPDRFQFRGSRSQIVKQIGNAVPPLLGRTIAQALIEQW